uniref:Zinc finger CCCH domain-containing protein 14 n=1 Tax=Glossina brevipalpis TaxID=37001 RepID=A0A1A9WF47_9MUSC
MDNYCNEIGQKMRSAVKAKLLELGTGGSAGYIDDELPDYVMIMVANKRSKQQMIADLNLFLGTQTELFVIWLHEVLQKLQEVTLPAASVAKKRKSSQKDEASSSAVSSNKKEKKVSKKEKHPVAKKLKDNISTTPERNTTTKPHSSITDIFAEELLEKAKQNLDLQADATLNIKKTKGRKTPEESVDNSSTLEQAGKVTNEFDIPTISEISSTTCGGNSAAPVGGSNVKEVNSSGNSREKDLAELAEIQKKIYAAKKQLKQLGELDEDEDFLNLRDDDSREAFNEAGDLVRKASVTPPPIQQSKKKSPIVFDRNSSEKHDQDVAEPACNEDNDEKRLSLKRKRFTPPPQLSSAAAAAAINTNSTQSIRNEKRPVHERLGVKATIITSNLKEQRSLTLAPRERRKILQEKELYVPAFRRKEMERERERERERSRECERGARERGRERERRIDRSRDRDRDNSKARSRQSRSLEEHIKRRSNSDHSRADERNSSQVRKITTTTPASGGRARSSSADASPETTTASTTTQRRRIGSRVIVAPVKAIEPSDEEELNDKPVNSVIKIKPRPPMSPSKQAPKNLLLRAVAEAQRSTILNKPIMTTNAATTPTKSKVSLRLGERIQGERNTKLYTKSYRDRLKNSAGLGVGALFRRTTQNLIVEVNGSGGSSGSKQKYKLRLENEDEEYIPESVSDRGESDQDYIYVPQTIRTSEDREIDDVYEPPEPDYEECEDGEVRSSVEKTQFVVTLNEDKALPKLKRHTAATRYSRSLSPPPQVSSSSSSSRDREPTSTSNSNHTRKPSVKERLSLKGSYSSSLSSVEPKSSVSRQEATTPPLRRTELVEIYRKHKDIQKIIIKNDSEDDDMSPTKKSTPDKDKKLKRKHDEIEYKTHKLIDIDDNVEEENNNDSMRSTTPPLKDQIYQKEGNGISSNTNVISTSNSPLKRKHTPIKFDLTESRGGDEDGEGSSNSPTIAKRRRSPSREKEHNRERERDSRQSREKDRDSSHERREEKRKISIRNSEAKKYDNIPSSLNSVSVDSGAYRSLKPKERCKYHPNCTKTFCEYYHPSAPCKSFPNCKYADKCMYSHPRCKYDLACVNLDCNFSHSGPRRASLLESSAPPLSSHVVPVQNYKSISATTAIGPVSSTTCKYFPNCTKSTCPFYHPKPCRYGKNCINKFECLFSHQELPSSSKFKWVASVN